MANWQGAILTNAGIALQARVEAGETKLNLTKLKLGDGTPASLETMTDLSSPKQVVGITSITPNDDGTIVVNGTVSNTGLTEGYYLREYGLFAKDDSNNEVLYCVSVDTNPDYLQPEGSATTISEELGLTIAVSNTADITVNVTSVGMASMLDLNNHNGGTDSHPNGLTHPLMDWVASYLYKVGDVRVYNKKIWRCKTANSDAVFDKTKWDNIGGAGAKVGDIKAIAYTSTVEEGWLLCDGASLSKTMYPDLYAVIGDTYGSVDSDHFNLPDLVDKFIEGGATSGTEKMAGLPNIIGDIFFHVTTGAHSGAFNSYGNTYTYDATSSSGAGGNINFDASRANSIYGNSTTVQPPALVLRYIIKAFDGQTSDSALIDVTQYANELNRKFGQDDFAIIYPNGGTVENPANVTVNSRYVMPNPFSGYYVNCIAEIKYNGEWSAASWAGNPGTGSAAYGYSARQFGDNIVLKTGPSQLVYASNTFDGGWPNDNNDIISAPCRIKVWKIGKV